MDLKKNVVKLSQTVTHAFTRERENNYSHQLSTTTLLPPYYYYYSLPPTPPLPPLSPPHLHIVHAVLTEKIHVELAMEVSPLVSEEAANQVHAVLITTARLRRTPVTVAHQLA